MNEAEEEDERLEYKQLKNQLHKNANRQEKKDERIVKVVNRR